LTTAAFDVTALEPPIDNKSEGRLYHTLTSLMVRDYTDEIGR
jgi:hypothetical protein